MRHIVHDLINQTGRTYIVIDSKWDYISIQMEGILFSLMRENHNIS